MDNFYKITTTSRTRGHSFKLEKPRCNLDIRKYCFSNRVVDIWNSLPEHVVYCESLETFKIRLDDHLKSRVSEYFS